MIAATATPWEVWIDRSRSETLIQDKDRYDLQLTWLKNIDAKFRVFGSVRWDQRRFACRQVAIWYMYTVLKIPTDRIAEMFGLHIVTVHRSLPDRDQEKSLPFLRAKRDMIPYLRDVTTLGTDVEDMMIQIKQIVAELQLDTPSRKAHVVMKRNLVMLRLFRTGMFTLQELGGLFSRDHSSVIYSLRKVESEWYTSLRVTCEEEIFDELTAIDQLFIVKM